MIMGKQYLQDCGSWVDAEECEVEVIKGGSDYIHFPDGECQLAHETQIRINGTFKQQSPVLSEVF